MPGNPFTDPNWAADLADTVERVVGTVRDNTTQRVVVATRAVVFGLLIGVLGFIALLLLLLTSTRILQVLLDLAMPHYRSVYVSYFIVGGILCIAGLLVLRKRFTES